MRRIRWFALAATVAVPTVLACSSFTAGPATQAADASIADASVDVVTADGPVTDGSNAEEPCADDRVLLGSNGSVLGTPDTVGQGAVDLYGYKPSAPSLAQCIRIFLRPGSQATSLTLGVYTDHPDQRPDRIIGAARIADTSEGWHSAKLDAPVPLDPATTYWLAVVGNNATVAVSYAAATCPPGAVKGVWWQYSVGATLPNPYTPGENNGDRFRCGLEMYLSP